MAWSTRGFGAPVTDAGGNVARTSAPVPTPGRSRPVTVETRCQSPGWASGAHSAGTATDPGTHTRPRSLRARSVIITFSARSLALRSSTARCPAVPLIGRVSTASPRRRRNRSGEADTTARSPNRSRAACGAGWWRTRAPNRRQGVGGRLRGQPAGEVDLVALAGPDEVHDLGDPGLEARPGRGWRRTAPGRDRPRTGRAGGPPAARARRTAAESSGRVGPSPSSRRPTGPTTRRVSNRARLMSGSPRSSGRRRSTRSTARPRS